MGTQGGGSGGGRRVRAGRDFAALEQRRKRAGRLFALGERLAAVARRLQVSRQSVSRWFRCWERGGASALRGAGRAGRAPRLKAAQLSQVDAALRQGARAHGFNTEKPPGFLFDLVVTVLCEIQ